MNAWKKDSTVILARKDLFYVSVLYLIIFLSYNIYHRSAEDKAGKFYNKKTFDQIQVDIS